MGIHNLTSALRELSRFADRITVSTEAALPAPFAPQPDDLVAAMSALDLNEPSLPGPPDIVRDGSRRYIAVDASSLLLMVAARPHMFSVTAAAGEPAPLDAALVDRVVPDLERHYNTVVDAVRLFDSLGLHLIWYLDGHSDDVKEDTRLKRQAANQWKTRRVAAILDSPDGDDLAHKLPDGELRELAEGMPYSPLLMANGRSALQAAGALLVQCVGEADHQIARDARRERHIVAVLSNDSDFFLAPDGDYLFIHVDSLARDAANSLSFLCWNEARVRRALLSLIDSDDDASLAMWQLSFLMGNDYTANCQRRKSHAAKSAVEVMRRHDDVLAAVLLDDADEASRQAAESARAYTQRLHDDPASVVDEQVAALCRDDPRRRAVLRRIVARQLHTSAFKILQPVLRISVSPSVEDCCRQTAAALLCLPVQLAACHYLGIGAQHATVELPIDRGIARFHGSATAYLQRFAELPATPARLRTLLSDNNATAHSSNDDDDDDWLPALVAPLLHLHRHSDSREQLATLLAAKMAHYRNDPHYHLALLSVAYLVQVCALQGDRLTDDDVLALVAMVEQLRHGGALLDSSTGAAHPLSYWPTPRPALRCATLMSRYQQVVHSFTQLADLVAAQPPGFPRPTQLVNSKLFCLLWSKKVRVAAAPPDESVAWLTAQLPEPDTPRLGDGDEFVWPQAAPPCLNDSGNRHCWWGTFCRFTHSPSTQAARPAVTAQVCRFFNRGECKYGQSCHNVHQQDATSSSTSAHTSPSTSVRSTSSHTSTSVRPTSSHTSTSVRSTSSHTSSSVRPTSSHTSTSMRYTSSSVRSMSSHTSSSVRPTSSHTSPSTSVRTSPSGSTRSFSPQSSWSSRATTPAPSDAATRTTAGAGRPSQASTKSVVKCRNFASGTCKYGTACHFSHARS